METLIIHPTDPSTDFLLPIQETYDPKTVIRGKFSKSEILDKVAASDRIVAMGHGCENGLLAVNQFPGDQHCIVDFSFVEMLKTKSANIFIWCFAKRFAIKHQIPCFATDMFISEPLEAIFYFEIEELDFDMIDASNACFVKEIDKFGNLPIDELYQKIITGPYADLAETNMIARFNLKGLYLSQ
jgi:hypothetical protein